MNFPQVVSQTYLVEFVPLLFEADRAIVTSSVDALLKRRAQCAAAVLVWAAAFGLHAQPLPPATQQGALPAEINLVSEPLGAALARLMSATGLAIVVDSDLTDGLRSATVEGIFAPEQALHRMLAGTGLEARAIGPGLFTLARLPQARRPLPRFTDFAAAVQATVTSALCKKSDTRPVYYRTVMRLWFDPAGVVIRAELANSTGDRTLDMAVTRSLQRLDVGMPVPSSLPQPMKLAIMPGGTESAACPAGDSTGPATPGAAR